MSDALLFAIVGSSVALVFISIIVLFVPKYERLSLMLSVLLAVATTSPAGYKLYGIGGVLAASIGVTIAILSICSMLASSGIAVRSLLRLLAVPNASVSIRLGVVRAAERRNARARATILSKALRDPDVSVRLAVARAFN